MEATLNKRWDTRDQMIGPQPDDQKELRILNLYAAMVQRWVGLCGEFETWQRGCRRLTALLDAKMTNSSRSTKKRNACISESLQSSTILRTTGWIRSVQLLVQQVLSRHQAWRHESGEASWTIFAESTVCLAGFPFHDPRPEELLCYTDADWASDKTSRRSTSGGVVTLCGGVLNCCAKKQKSVALSSWESEFVTSR